MRDAVRPSAALVLRVWSESPGRAGFRARVTAARDLTGTDGTLLVTADPDDVLATVRDWLDDFLDLSDASG